MDMTTLSDVELTKEWAKAAKGYPATRKQMDAIDAEAHRRGKARMDAAFDAVGRERDPAQYVTEVES